MRKFAVIGHPIGHTMSPFIHKRLFQLSGDFDAAYNVEDIAPENLRRQYPRLLSEYTGFNITIPHKNAMMDLAAHVDGSAARYGSVNVLDCKTNTGYSTDAYGFLQSLASEKIPLQGHVCILGCGGVARTFLYESAQRGCQITLAVRESGLQTARTLKREVQSVFPVQVECVPLGDIPGRFDLLINATPVGMYPHIEASPVDLQVIERARAVFDAVYNPRNTLLLRLARQVGVPAAGGMAMLVWQAVKAHEIWDNAHYEEEDVTQLIADAYQEMERHFQL